ncbi:MAG: hypothetical protein H6730_21985 [Deltaproteobacteria bacterium]|nr:hypothetical protein [Deltaproteobacteria bacterium]
MRPLLTPLLTALVALAPLAAPAQGDPAVTLVEQAAAAYQSGRYRAAAELFVSAYELSKAPIQLRNAAKAYTKAEALAEAETTWTRYRDLEGLSGADRAEAEAELAALRERRAATAARAEADEARVQAEAARAEAARAEAARAEAEAQAQAARAAPAPDPGPGVAPWLVLGAGAAAAAASAVLFFHANGRLSDLDTKLGTTDGQGLITGIHRDAAESELSGIEAERTASAVLLGVGAAGVVGGLLWALLDRPDEATAEATVWVIPGGAGGQVGFAF